METILLMLVAFAAYIAAYHTYGKYLARRIFKLDPTAPVPSRELADGVDYVASEKGVIFGHHFTSIAGTGPIVGPAIGVIWGWLPALLWIVFGSIFMGAVHDFGSLVVSMRHQGKSVSDIAAKYINARVRFMFFLVVFLALLIIIAIFGVVIAVVFKFFPSSIIPVWAQIPIAILLGYFVYKKNANITLATTIAVICMYGFVLLGAFVQSHWPGACTIPEFAAMPSTGSWTIILLIYAFIASILPVTTLLQPRDYTNAWQLFVMLGILVVSVIFTGFGGNLELVAPAVNHSPTGAPPIWPFMFVTIACGAVSGFHSLVASGTTPKQVSYEQDALFVGYGSMLLEGALAVLVLVCVAAGIGIAYTASDGSTLSGFAAWNTHYASWSGAQGLGAKLTAVVVGAANMMETIGLPKQVGTVLMGVFIASFAGTTLDTAVRLQRYITSELACSMNLTKLSNKWTATSFAVITAAIVAFATGADGKGAMVLWPLFGTVNQLLASLALLVVTMYLKKKVGNKSLIAAFPCVFMLTITIWALVIKLKDFINGGDWLLITLSSMILVLAVWMFIETAILFCKKNS
ncbi:MAG: carbon starvation protein A [Sedimentisphaeraceae bacterium JB056]